MTFSWDALRKWLWGNKTAAPSSVASESTGQPGTGAILDTRTPQEKDADIHFAELVANAAVVSWVFKMPSAWRRFPSFNQAGCLACVAFTTAKLLGVMRWLKDGVFVTFSPGDIYRRRVNRYATGEASEGMNSTDPYIIASQGVTLDALVPSQNLSEGQMNALTIPEYASEVASLFKVQNPKAIILPTGDIDAVASVIQATGKAVMVWFYFTSREWGNAAPGLDYNVPVVMDALSSPGAAAALRHSVSAVDFTYDAQGRKCLVIEDSAWFGGFNRRLVTENWYRARNFFAAYPMNFAQEKTANALPRYVFSKSLSFIAWDDGTNAPVNTVLNAAQLSDVKALQTVLQAMTDSRGKTYFPTNISPSGYYGALTAQAVYAWGIDHLLPTVPRPTLDSLAGTVFGQASIAEMNAELA